MLVTSPSGPVLLGLYTWHVPHYLCHVPLYCFELAHGADRCPVSVPDRTICDLGHWRTWHWSSLCSAAFSWGTLDRGVWKGTNPDYRSDFHVIHFMFFIDFNVSADSSAAVADGLMPPAVSADTEMTARNGFHQREETQRTKIFSSNIESLCYKCFFLWSALTGGTLNFSELINGWK